MAFLKKERKLELVLKKTKQVGECMEWLGGFYRRMSGVKSYPYITYMGRPHRGNRLVLWLYSGEKPTGMQALHTCDNSKCINPKHLYWGTAQQNAIDARDRKRSKSARVTECPMGHPYSGTNLLIGVDGYRYCRSCRWFKNRGLPVLKTLAPPYNAEIAEAVKEIK